MRVIGVFSCLEQREVKNRDPFEGARCFNQLTLGLCGINMNIDSCVPDEFERLPNLILKKPR